VTQNRFHLVRGVEPEKGINASESVGNNRLAFEPTFSSDDRKKLLEDAVKRKNLLYLRALPNKRGQHRNR
jgi:hypothetical protein